MEAGAVASRYIKHARQVLEYTNELHALATTLHMTAHAPSESTRTTPCIGGSRCALIAANVGGAKLNRGPSGQSSAGVGVVVVVDSVVVLEVTVAVVVVTVCVVDVAVDVVEVAVVEVVVVTVAVVVVVVVFVAVDVVLVNVEEVPVMVLEVDVRVVLDTVVLVAVVVVMDVVVVDVDRRQFRFPSPQIRKLAPLGVSAVPCGLKKMAPLSEPSPFRKQPCGHFFVHRVSG